LELDYMHRNTREKSPKWTVCYLLSASTVLVAVGCQPAARTGFAEQPLPIEYVDQTYHHRYGMEVAPDHWYKSGCSGQVITSLRDGINVSQTYLNGMLNGEATYTFPNSTQIESRLMYHDDVVVSEMRYGPSGAPRYSKEYSGPEIWTETHWYESGQPKSVEKYERGLLINAEYYTPDHQKDSWVYAGEGERVTRDDWGNFVSLDAFRGGELTSTTTRHSNGSTHEITPYAAGRIHGERKSYYPGGDPMAIEVWLNGERTGVTQIFQNGEKYADVPYLVGKKNGIERRYRDGAIVSQEVSWADDKMHGPMHTYVGDSVQTDWFFRGRLTSRANFESFALPKRPMPSY
jgi:antitoxin component YwqK of YwqJK toxin-antitoxin module